MKSRLKWWDDMGGSQLLWLSRVPVKEPLWVQICYPVTSYLLMEQYLHDLISFSSHLIRLFPEIFALLSYANKSIVPSISKIQLDWPALRHQAKSSFLWWEFMSLCISDSEHILTILWLTFLIENQSTTYFRSVQESGFCDIDYVLTIDRGPRDLADQLTLFKSGGSNGFYGDIWFWSTIDAL